MKWQEIRKHYPHQWFAVEAIKARSEAGKRILDDLSIANAFPDSRTAMKGYIQRNYSATRANRCNALHEAPYKCEF